MPKNKRESLIFTCIMCPFMVYIMSVYNIALVDGISLGMFTEAWIGLPIAFIFAALCDWFLVSGLSKKIVFSFLSQKTEDWKKILAISSVMVCFMVIIMSFFGTIHSNGLNSSTPIIWLKCIPFNFIVAMPLQLLIAGPLVRYIFRRVFPEGAIVS